MTAVGIFGAGLSGLCMGMQLQRAGINDFTIYERLDDVGGTWLRNTYPGLHCDVPSHLYCYSFEPNPDWSMVYSGQAEIQRYLRRCAERYGLIERTRFATAVQQACYDEGDGTWTLDVAGAAPVTHRVLVSATGGLTAPRLPRIDGIDRFAGPLWHSGAWRDDVHLGGLRVAVVGSAASAVQVVPEVAKRAARVVVYSRTPNCVMPRGNRAYTDEEKAALREDPRTRARVRRHQYRNAMVTYGAFQRRPADVAQLRALGMRNMRRWISDPEMIAALTPDYDPGCKRILVSDDYYPALAQDHVKLVPQGVAALTATSVVAADGSEEAVDAVIFCTGYRLGGREDGRPAVEVFGRGGKRLAAALGERPEAFRGLAIPGFPNYFTICGVNGVVSYASLFLSAEAQTGYIFQAIRHLLDGGVVSIEANRERTRRYNEAIQGELQRMSWTGNCTNFYRDRTGRVLAFHPGSLTRFRRELRRLDLDEFDVIGAS